VADKTGISTNTIARWCADLVEEIRVKKEASIKLLQETAKSDPTFSARQYGKDHGLHEKTISRYIRGVKRTLPDTPKIPESETARAKRLKARELYTSGKNYNQIRDETGFPKSSISEWCRDLVAQNRTCVKPKQDEELRLKIRALYSSGKTVVGIASELSVGTKLVTRSCKDLITERKLSGTYVRKVKPKSAPTSRQILTDSNVIELRETVNRTGNRGWPMWSSKFGASIAVISMAARGITFKHLNATAPPVGEYVSKRVDKYRLDENLVAEALALRREDPRQWTYGALASWFSEKTGRKYSASHMAVMLVNRDPSIKELEALTPKRVRVPRVKAAPKPPKLPKTPEQLRHRALAAKQRRDALKKMIDAENAREAWVNAGCPDDWIWPE
jgi:uncharacterized protein YerC